MSATNCDAEQCTESPSEAQQLTSVKELKGEIIARQSTNLATILRGLVYVGIVDNNYILVQYKTGLFLLDIVELTKELFFQVIITRFGSFRRQQLDEPLSVKVLLEVFLESKLGTKEAEAALNKSGHSKVVCEACRLLEQKKLMLDEYFGITFSLASEDDILSLQLVALPELLEHYWIEKSALPVFLYRLCTQVTWTEEKACFKTCAFELAELFSVLPKLPKDFKFIGQDSTGESSQRTIAESALEEEAGLKVEHSIKHILLPALKSIVLPPKAFEDPKNGVFSKVASLEELYRVFERC